MKKIMILGATGSIGKQTVDLIIQHPDTFCLYGITAHHNIDEVLSILDKLPCELVGMDEHYRASVENHEGCTKFMPVSDLVAIIEALPKDVVIVNALVGSVGLAPTIKAIERNLDVLLANKETLVVGGELIQPLLKTSTSSLIPIDSEHSALRQCLIGHDLDDVEKVVITASGGSFRDLNRDDLQHVTVEDALKHPNWTMGAKITIDSATLMNKVFEVIEAHYLFDLPYEQIEAVLHRESIVHGFVHYKDGNILVHVGPSDMHIPILTAMQGNHRLPYRTVFDITKIKTLHFEPIDIERYPLFDLGLAVAKRKGLHVVTMNAANEEAVALFLKGKISFLEIEQIIKTCLDVFEHSNHLTLEKILAHDQAVRKYIRNKYQDGETQ